MPFLGFDRDAVILVTGAGSGIGAGIALEAAREGLAVVAWDVNVDAAAATAKSCREAGARAIARGVDVSDEEAVTAAWREDSDALGSIAYLAGVAGPPSFLDRGFDEAVQLCLRCMRAPVRALLGQDLPIDPAVVLYASVQGVLYGGGSEWYTVAKAAIDGYMKWLAAMRPGGIRANAIMPDWILTPRTAPHADAIAPKGVWTANPMRRMGLPVDCAKATLFLLSPAAAYINGVSLPLDGGVGLRSAAWLAASKLV